jgi:hypothetical protein
MHLRILFLLFLAMSHLLFLIVVTSFMLMTGDNDTPTMTVSEATVSSTTLLAGPNQTSVTTRADLYDTPNMRVSPHDNGPAGNPPEGEVATVREATTASPSGLTGNFDAQETGVVAT